MKPRFLLAALAALVVARAPATAGPLPVVVLGDSISDPYANYTGALNPSTGLPFWGSAGDKNWVEQIRALRGPAVPIYDFAKAGATSADMIAQNQQGQAAALVAAHQAQAAAVIIGANDVLAYLTTNLGGDPTPMIAALGAKLGQALDALKAAGPVNAVVANIPNISVTPVLQQTLGAVPGALALVSQVVQAFNGEIAMVAGERHLPVIDLYGLSNLTTGPIVMAGAAVPPTKYFAPDYFHPGTVLQGLLANSFLEAQRRFYHADVTGLPLSDQEILTLAGVPHAGGAQYFNVSQFVSQTPEPSTMVLAVVGLAAAGVVRRRGKGRPALGGTP